MSMASPHRNARRGSSLLLLVAGFVLAAAGAAFAFWTVGVILGTGSYASAKADSLSPPTAPTATVGGSGRITVGWSLPTTQLLGAQYQLTRTGPGSPATVCTVASTVTSCQDNGLTAGTTYSYSVAGLLGSWNSTAVTTSATTATPSFTIALSAGPYSAGTAVTVQTITAKIGASTDTTYAGSKSITWSGLASSPSGQAPSYPSSSVTFTNGVASPGSTFTAYASGSSTIAATDAAPAVTGSATFTVSPAAAAKLAFLQQPTNTTAGVAISPAVTVRIEDQFGNLTTSTSNVTLAGATFNAGTNPRAAVAGVATFNDLSVNTAGAYTLTAASGGLAGAASTSFTISPAAAAKLAFLQQPTNTTAGVAINPAVTVRIEDQFGNLTTSTSNVTLAGATFNSSTNPKAAVAGVATFNDLKVNTAGSYTLNATSGTLATATSTSFTISPAAAAKLAFSKDPTDTKAGKPITPAVKVTVEDSFGNQTGSNAMVTLVLNGGTGTLSGTNPKAAVNGLATFSDLSVNTVGTNYTLTATSGGLTGATSSTFVVS